MQKILSLVLVLALTLLLVPSATFAKPTPAKSNIVLELSRKSQKQYISEQELFIIMVSVIAEYGEIPSTYELIKVENAWTIPGTRLYKAYQKALYLDILKVSQIPLKFTGIATHQKMVDLINIFYGEKVDGKILVDGTELTSIKRRLTYDDMLFYAQNYLGSKDESSAIKNAPGFDILTDVYNRIKEDHIEGYKFDDRELLYWAIQWLAESTGDKYTTYFPPAAAEEFIDELNGEFEGIGAYVDMEKPGVLVITSPLPGSPAEKVGIKGGDQVVKVDDFIIVKDTPIEEVISKIKWPAGTSVKLTILRNGTEIEFTVTRENIKIEPVTYKKLDTNTSYIQVTSFGSSTYTGFVDAINTMTENGTTKLILDLRNNPGGDVEEVSEMLNYFVPAGKSKLYIKSNNNTETFLSTGQDAITAKQNVVILINSWTASASEVMAGTIKDYLGKRVKIVGETSFGKGSVQSLIPYYDGSTIKLTTAKWYTGWTSRSIDHIGIVPDIMVEFDEEKFKNGIDNQLDYARSLNF